MGFEKSKVDHCISVWDTGLGAPVEGSIKNVSGLGETAHSLCWDEMLLVAGMSQKYIKVIDFRQTSATTVNTRAVHGLTISPNGRYLAGFCDNVVSLFDLRKFSEPISNFQLQSNLAQISWSPTRLNCCLLCLQKDSSRTLNVIDIHWSATAEGDSDGGAHFIKRTVAPFEIVDRRNKFQLINRSTKLENVCWHPQQPGRMMAFASSSNSQPTVMEFDVPERTIAIFDKWNRLWGPVGSEIHEIPMVSPPSTPTTDASNSWFGDPLDGDLTEVIQKRIHQEYGQFNELEKNARACMDPSLQRVWRLLGQMQRSDCFIGLRTILGIVHNSNELTIAHSTQEVRSFIDFSTNGSIRVYKSEERDFAQELCGWAFHKSGDVVTNLQAHVEDLCKRKKYTRAAMLAVFHMRIQLAINILTRGAHEMDITDTNLHMASIALSGFTGSESWRAQCAIVLQQIVDPHLKCIFSFLSDETYEGVLNESNVSISDRMAFACTFLNDRQLSEYVKRMIQTSIEKGDLNGLLVTGATHDGIQLLQAFVDRTDDVQTAAIIGSKIMPTDLQSDNRIQNWIATLRNLMDVWEMWEKRAAFDISIGAGLKTSPKSPKAIYLLCSFCGKSVSAALQEDARLRNQRESNKLSSCPNCRKPLPRCSLCLLHMGTATVSGFYNPVGMKSKLVQNWFAFCQTCRHGGHTKHLADWFKTHTECPVTCCNCKCFAIDLPLKGKTVINQENGADV